MNAKTAVVVDGSRGQELLIVFLELRGFGFLDGLDAGDGETGPVRKGHKVFHFIIKCSLMRTRRNS